MGNVKIKKIKHAGSLIYPATILDAVKDASVKITVAGRQLSNPNYGKTVREILEGQASDISTINTNIGTLADLNTTAKGTVVAAINEVNTAIANVASSDAVSANTTAIATLNGTGEGSVAKAVDDAKKAIIGTSATQNEGTSETLTSIDERVDVIETALNVAGTDQSTIDKVDEVLTWFSGIQESDPQGAAVITAVSAVGTKGAGTTPSTGLIKDVEDLKAVGATKVTVSATNGVTDANGNTYKYVAPEGTVVDADYHHVSVSATDGVTANGVTYKYTAEAGTVVDAAYKHITVTANSVSDGTTTMTLPELSVKTGSANYLGVVNHEVEAKVSDVTSTATGLASALAVYNYALTAEDATDTTDYEDVF